MKRINLGPSLRRIMRLEKQELLKHYALIKYKGSSLSSNQRKFVESRVFYGVEQGEITVEEVEKSVEDLSNFIKEQYNKLKNNNNDESSPKE